ncbi:MAG TPA: immunoglobulin domain-containing protein [Opitutus sp.]|nr:immunoglobulin domain-containing protein [Opitutus sp.]
MVSIRTAARCWAAAICFSWALAGSLTAQQAFTVAAWGDNSSGQLTAPASAAEIAAVGAGDGHVAALRSDGKLIAWGRNDHGQTNVPTVDPGTGAPLTFFAVAAGARHTFALSSAGLLSWGEVTAVPAPADNTPLRALAAGGDFNLVLDINGKVTAGGGNAFGQTAVPSGAQAGVLAIAAGDSHALALKADGTVVAWGKNDFGQANVPAAAHDIFAISAGRDFSVALRRDGVVVVWGHGADSYLLPPDAAYGASRVCAGADYILAQTDAGLLVWGASGRPAQMPASLDHVSALAAGAHTAFAVRAPYFTRLPGLVVVRTGERAELTAAVSYAAGMMINWSPVTAQPNSLTLAFDPAISSFSTAYTVTVTYATGYSMSATGMLVVLDPPTIGEGGGGQQIARENESVELFVTVGGSGPFTFQWRKDGVAIPGATSRDWTLQPVQPSDAGNYSCVVSNPIGAVESVPRQLIVFPPRNGREDHFTLVEPGASVALRVYTANQPPPISNYSWTKDDVVIPGAVGTELIVSDFSAEKVGSYRVHFTDGLGQTGNSTFFHLDLYHPTGPPFHAWLSPSEAIVKPTDRMIVRLGGVDSYPGMGFRWTILRWAVPDSVLDGTDLTSITLDLSAAPDRAGITVWPDDPALASAPVYGAIDVRSEDQPPGTIISYGGPSQLLEGETGEFSVEFAPPVDSVVWTKDGVVIPTDGPTRCVIASATKADAGTYVATAHGSFGTRSATWGLGIIDLPTITTQPVNTTLVNGSAQLAVTLSQSLPSGYVVDWYRDGEEFWYDRGTAGATSTLTTRLTGTYRARILLDTGILESNSAVVAASGGANLVDVRPGVYLDPHGAAYVRHDRSVVLAAALSGDAVAWLGETVINADGTALLPTAIRVVADDERLVRDDTLGFAVSFTGDGRFRGFPGSIAGQEISAMLSPVTDRGREGLYRGPLPGTPGGEIWVFVSADGQANVYLQDGYAIYSSASLPLGALEFNDTDPSVTYTISQFVYGLGNVVVGRFVAYKETDDATARPRIAETAVGSSRTLTVAASVASAPRFQWQRNGLDIPSALGPTLVLPEIVPADCGLYSASVTAGSSSTTSTAAIVGFMTDQKVEGAGEELSPADIRHPNGNVFDQVLLTGPAEAITADFALNQITRTSFIDPDGDIVQVEMSGPGTLTLVLDGASGPAAPEKYHQAVNYMQGRAGIVIVGGDDRTNVSVFSVGRLTAFDPTGKFNIVLPISSTNDPAGNGNPIFDGHPASSYDGVADIAFIAIASTDGKFGGLRAANARFSASAGLTGIYAPDVAFVGPAFVGNIDAKQEALPVLEFGSVSDLRISGGDLAQENGAAVEINGFSRVRFVDGIDSHGRALPAQSNQARFVTDGIDVTDQIAVTQ